MPDESDERGDPESADGSRDEPVKRSRPFSEEGSEPGAAAAPDDATETEADDSDAEADGDRDGEADDSDADEDTEERHDSADDTDSSSGSGESVDEDDAPVEDEPVDVEARKRESGMLSPDDEPMSDEDEVDEDEASDADGSDGQRKDEPEDAADDETTEDAADGDDTKSPAPEEVDEADAPAVETDGEGFAGDYVGEQLQQYKPATPSQQFHKKRKEEREEEDDDDWDGLSTPPDDREMPLADHIEEMMLRLAVVLLFGAAGTAIGLLFASDAIAIIWEDVIPQPTDGERLAHVYHPLELWMTRIKLSALLGIMVALPAFVYQCYLFMRPGLYPHERKYYLAAVPTSVVLAALGMVFSYLVILPILFAYFTFYSEGSAQIAYALGETFDLVITLTGFLAIVFQIPLFIMLAIMLGVTTRQWLASKRLYFWAGFFGLSFMFTMDPTFMAPVFVAITMIILFEGTLLLLKWTGR